MDDRQLDLEAESRRLAASIGDDVYWFAGSDRRNFIDPLTASALASLILTTFLKSAAAAAGAAAGKLAWDAALEALRKTVSGEQKPVAADLQPEARAAQSHLKSLTEVARDAALDAAGDSMKEAVAARMPPHFAATLAERVKAAARALVK